MSGTEIDAVHGVAAASPGGVHIEAVHGVAASIPLGLMVDAVHGVAASFSLSGVPGLLTVSAHGVAAAWVTPPEPEDTTQKGYNTPTKEPIVPTLPTYTLDELRAQSPDGKPFTGAPSDGTEGPLVPFGGQRIRAVSSLPTQVQTVQIDGAVYRLRLTWRRRAQRWYMDIFTQAGEPLIVGRALTPGWDALGARGNGLPAVLAYVSDASDEYDREALGESLTVTFYRLRRMKTTRGSIAALTSVSLDGRP